MTFLLNKSGNNKYRTHETYILRELIVLPFRKQHQLRFQFNTSTRAARDGTGGTHFNTVAKNKQAQSFGQQISIKI